MHAQIDGTKLKLILTDEQALELAAELTSMVANRIRSGTNKTNFANYHSNAAFVEVEGRSYPGLVAFEVKKFDPKG